MAISCAPTLKSWRSSPPPSSRRKPARRSRGASRRFFAQIANGNARAARSAKPALWLDGKLYLRFHSLSPTVRRSKGEVGRLISHRDENRGTWDAGDRRRGEEQMLFVERLNPRRTVSPLPTKSVFSRSPTLLARQNELRWRGGPGQRSPCSASGSSRVFIFSARSRRSGA